MAKLPKQRVAELYSAVTYSMKQLKPFRENRLALLKLYTAGNYGSGSDVVPFNLTELTLNIYLQRLANSPNILCSTPYKQIKHRANLLGMALNHLLSEIEFSDTLEMTVLEAMISVGIMKTGIEMSTQAELNGFLHDAGQPFSDSIGLDDWVHDMSALRYDKGQFFGNRYKVPYELAMDSGLFKDKDSIKEPSQDNREDRDSKLSQGTGGSDRDEYSKTIELWDFWLPAENIILTVQGNDKNREAFDGPVLRAFDWAGPEHGPYRMLSFNRVPNNIMPLPPAALWRDMAELANKLFIKISRQANRQKTITGVRKSGEGDGDRVLNASDGQMIAMDDPKNVQEYNFGGVKQESLAFLVYIRDLFSYMQGNLDALGGLSPQAETLGQEEMITAGASARMMKMRRRVEDFTTLVAQDLGLYLWTDPSYKLPLVQKTPVAGYEASVVWGPEHREGDFFDYNVTVEPFSMERKTPEQRLMFIDKYMQQTVLPMMPMLAQQGIMINFEALNKIYARYGRMPELEEIISFADPQMPQENPVEVGGKAPVTTRNYVRQSRPGATRQGHDQVFMNTLMGGNNQMSEQKSLMRPVG